VSDLDIWTLHIVQIFAGDCTVKARLHGALKLAACCMKAMWLFNKTYESSSDRAFPWFQACL